MKVLLALTGDSITMISNAVYNINLVTAEHRREPRSDSWERDRERK